MNYEQIQLTSVRHNTYDEGKILYDLILKYRPNNILEIGTFGGYNTIWLASSLDEVNSERFVYSLDYDRKDILPSAEEMLKRNNLSNVFFSKTDNISTSLLAYINNASLIFIDECHDKMDLLVEEIQKCSEKDKIIIFHDVLCEYVNMMKTPKVFSELIKKYPKKCEVIETKDDNGNLNGFGIYHFRKEIVSSTTMTLTESEIVQETSNELAISVFETEEESTTGKGDNENGRQNYEGQKEEKEQKTEETTIKKRKYNKKSEEEVK